MRHQHPTSDDSDDDGVNVLLEYALLSDGPVACDSALPTDYPTDDPSGGADQLLTLSFQRNPAADDLVDKV